MAVEATMVNFLAEAKCSICLEELTNPVTIDCGHNFCRSCIQQSWANLQGRFSCPVCRQRLKEQDLRSNDQLRRIIEIIKHVHSSRGKRTREENRSLCEKHHQVLTLFCEEHLELLCPQCVEEPTEHQGHCLMPIAEAAHRYRKQFHGYVKSLKSQIDEVQKLMSEQSKKPSALRCQLKNLRRELSIQWERHIQFLERQERLAFSRLEDEASMQEETLNENIDAFSNYISTHQSLLGKIAGHRGLSDEELLSEVQIFYQKSEKMYKPTIFQINLAAHAYNFPPQYSALQKAINLFKEDLILDPETAHPNLIVSKDKSRVTYSKRKRIFVYSKRFMANPAVLAFPVFASGRHFWEVQVRDKPGWALGVSRANLTKLSRELYDPPECWRLMLGDEGYEAAPEAYLAPLQLDVRAKRIGIFLDYEMGELSFYRMPEKSHICTFRAHFSEPLRPYFCVGPNSKSLKILKICTAAVE